MRPLTYYSFDSSWQAEISASKMLPEVYFLKIALVSTKIIRCLPGGTGVLTPGSAVIVS